MDFGIYWRTAHGSVEVLCFDEWSDGHREAWIVQLPLREFNERMSEVNAGKRSIITEDMLADYDSLIFDPGEQGYELLEREVRDGHWTKLEW